jgi:hypothetical protein
MVAREDEEAGKGEDGVVSVTRVLLPRVSIVPSEVLAPHLSARLTDNFTRPVVVHARVCVSLTHSMTGMRKARVRGPCVVTGRLTGSTPLCP